MKITIVGGGTAGWLTALYAKKIYPHYEITLIESDSIGILGAGEGSTPILIEFLDFLNIPVSTLIKKCNATIKNGIKFTNWSNNIFFSPFVADFNLNNEFLQKNDQRFLNNNVDLSFLYNIEKNKEIKTFIFTELLSIKNKVPFIFKNNDSKLNPILKFDQVYTWSIHFNAVELAKELKAIGVERGIIRVEGIVQKIQTKENNFIKSLIVNNKEIKTNFVFDCTGFKRLIIGNFYKSKWRSFSNKLPVKKAIPFFLPMDKEIPPYTEAIAMNYGWMWKIPLQNRYGCGYIFDSNFISDDEAKKELDEYIGFKIESPKTFSFEAGCYEEIWINNCLSVGLSSGFLEPMEATSIGQIIKILERFFSNKNNLIKHNAQNIKLFNKIFVEENKENVDFLYLHYLNNKNKNNFWKNFKKNTVASEFIEYILSVAKERPLIQEYDFYKKYSWNSTSYNSILYGLNLVDFQKNKNYINFYNSSNEKKYLKNLEKNYLLINKCIDHKNFIKTIVSD